MRSIGTALVLVMCAFTAMSGCDKIRAIKKAAEGAANSQGNAATGQEAADPDDALSEKLGEYIYCLNYTDKSVSGSRKYYLSWADEKTGPTGKERYVGGVGSIDSDMCIKSLDKAQAMPPSLPEVQAAATAYKAALLELIPIASTAEKYYKQNDYKDDKLAKGKQMHAPLMAAFAKFETADKTFDDLVTRMNEDLGARQLQKLAKDPKNRLQYLAKLAMARSKDLIRLVDIGALKDLDAAKYQAALESVEKANTDLESYATSNKAEVDKISLFSSYLGDQEEFIKAGKELMRRKRDNKDFNKESASESSPESVDGHPAQVIDKYNHMINSSNSLRF